MKLWLDDVRPIPGPDWTLAKTVSEAQNIIQKGLFSSAERWEEASLDHDLGTCDVCAEACKTGPWPIIVVKEGNCVHNGTGLDLVRWMAEKNYWPVQKPLVHSWNPPGKAAMEAVIERHFPR